MAGLQAIRDYQEINHKVTEAQRFTIFFLDLRE